MEQYNPVKVEHEILKFWKKNKTYEKQKKLYAKSNKRWSFIDGPITANNPMGVHHAWGRTLKDIYLRWRAAQRYNIRRQNGFDCQGLWIEVEVEKEKGFKSVKNIEKYGIGRFVEACKSRTDKMAKKQTEQSIRLGQWMDWDDSYYTHSFKANDYKWWFIKFCHEKGWLYKGKDVVPWCPRCSCTVSKHAITTEGYWEEMDKALFMKFPVQGKSKEYLLIFTTTPWTIPANVAVAAHPDVYYARAKKDDEIYILAEKLVENVLPGAKILNRFLGCDLEGVKYDMPYKNFPVQQASPVSGKDEDLIPAPHTVVMWDEASEEEGTGLVHVAPGAGPEDYQLGIAERLPAISPLDEQGKYTEGYDWLTGMSAYDANQKVIDNMERRGYIFKIEEYTHRYPHCTRCRSPVIFRLVPEWYISMGELRKPCLEANKTIRWVPKQGSSYEETWLKNMSDWLFSRKRYYGLAMPIWECECGEYIVVGSAKELKKKAIKGIKYFKEHRRPGVDKVLLKCPNCGKLVHRVKDTVDVWMDAGMVPFYTLDYFDKKDYFNKWFPADFVTECGPGQYRCWFFFMLMHSVAITNKAPFKSVLTNELVKDEKGNEMHKSLGNAIWFDEAAERSGSDVMRWLYSCQDVSRELWFGWNALEEKRKALNVLWNFGNYLQLYLTKKPKLAKLDVKAKWLVSRLESLKKKVTKSLEDLHPHEAGQAIENFFLNDLSRGYGHMVRDEIDSPAVIYTCYKAMLDLLVLMSPFVPFFTEKVYQELFKQEKLESIHLYEWPKPNTKLINKELEDEMEIVQNVVSTILAAREQMNRGVRWPVKSATIVTSKTNIKQSIKKYSDLITNMTNVLDLKIGKVKGAKLVVKANYAKLGPKLGKDVAEFIGKVITLSPQTVISKLDKGEIKIKLDSGKEVSATREDFIISEELPKDIISAEGIGRFSVYLDKEETKDMLASGFAREITRKVQDLRKKAKLVKKDRIDLTISMDLKAHLEEIKKKCGASKLAVGAVKGKYRTRFTIRGKQLSIGFNKI